MKRLLWIAIIVLVTACGADYGSRVEGGDLTVYYLQEKDGDLAKKTAEYMRDHDLLTGESQDLQLVRSDEGLVLKIIANDPARAKNMSFNERKLLLELQSQLSDSVFSPQQFELVVCNNKFEPIYDLNQ